METYAKWVVQHREKCAIEDVAARIDAHHLLFYLSVTHRILEATAKPESKENQVLDQAWDDLRQRFHQALSLMENTDLSDNEEINRIRKMIRYFNSGN